MKSSFLLLVICYAGQVFLYNVHLVFSSPDLSRPVLGCFFHIVILFLFHDVINHLLFFMFSSRRFCHQYLCAVIHHVVAHAQSSCAFTGEYCWSPFLMNRIQHFLISDFLRPADLQNFPPDPHFRCFYFLPWFCVIVHVSAPYNATLHTVAFTILFLPGIFCCQ